MKKIGAMELEKLIAFLIVVAVAVIIILGWRAGWFTGTKALVGTGEKVVKGLEDIDFSQLTASERDKVIEDAVSRDAEDALKSAKNLDAQGEYEKAELILKKIPSDVEGQSALLSDVNKKIEEKLAVREQVVNFINYAECAKILSLREGFDTDSKKLFRNYYAAYCYYHNKEYDFANSVVSAMQKRYPNHEITKRATKEFTNQKT